jgi:hypothetical protein
MVVSLGHGWLTSLGLKRQEYTRNYDIRQQKKDLGGLEKIAGNPEVIPDSLSYGLAHYL